MKINIIFTLPIFLAIASCSRLDSETSNLGLRERPRNLSCLATSGTFIEKKIEIERTFSNLTFDFPVRLVQPKNDNTVWYVAEQDGRVFKFSNSTSTATKELVLDISDQVVGPEETGNWEFGLLGLAISSDYTDYPTLYLYYTSDLATDGCPDMQTHCAKSRLSSFDLSIDPKFEKILLEIDTPSQFHHGGHIVFDSSDLLWLSIGDKGNNQVQDPNLLAGSLLRIDVHSNSPYGIPPDNPFIGDSERPEEVYAYGFRNPWHFSIDPLTQDIWLSDVGEGMWEEINKVESGGNYGWPIYEGLDCFRGPCNTETLIEPVFAYSHEIGCAVIGGYVYRGSAIPELQGTYLYADYCSGNIYGLRHSSDGTYISSILGNPGIEIASFTEDNDKELYLVDRNGGIFKIINFGTFEKPAYPTKISETGCFEKGTDLPTAGLIPYDVNMPLWSDGAEKQRWIALPEEKSIQALENGKWYFPNGTVLVKSFRLQGLLVETRFLLRDERGEWQGYSYEWNDTQDEAFLVDSLGKEKTVAGQIWQFPSRTQCFSCHTLASGRTLGLETANMNRLFVYPSGIESNQITTMAHVGVLEGQNLEAMVRAEAFPQLAKEWSESEPTEKLARAYLHVNCANCHQPNGPGVGAADFRYFIPFEEMGICDQMPTISNLGLEFGRILAPGDPENSILWQRMQDTGEYQMPPLGVHKIDMRGVILVRDWIHGIQSCEARP